MLSAWLTLIPAIVVIIYEFIAVVVLFQLGYLETVPRHRPISGMLKNIGNRFWPHAR